METTGKRTVSIVYKKAPEYRIVAASGAHGGPTPQGQVLCHFFVEYPDYPDSLTLEVDSASGSVKELKRDRKDHHYVRELQIGLVLAPEMAESIGKWLIDQAGRLTKTSLKLDS